MKLKKTLAAKILTAAITLAGFNSPAHVTGDPAHDGGTGTNRVTISLADDQRIIAANGWPDHLPGQFPRKGNPNTLSPQNYTFRMTLHPNVAATPTQDGGWFFAVAVNGVPFEPGTGETWDNNPRSNWRYEANTGVLTLGLAENNAHVQPTGAYHYHALPVGLVARLGGDGKKMLLVGWAADGFPLYTSYGHSDAKDANSPLKKMHASYRLKSGVRPGGPGGKYDGRFTQDFEYAPGTGDLDECNGRFGVTPEFPQGIYHYYITDEFPFVARLFRGTLDKSFQKNDGPPGRGGLRGNAVGRPGNFGGPPIPPVVTALDLNGDGVVDADEIAKSSTSLKKLDKNGDGKLTPDELRPGGAAFGSPPPDQK